MMKCWEACTSVRSSHLSFVFVPLLLTSSISCSRNPSEAPAVKAADPEVRLYNDAARFLAGLPGNPGSGYATLEKSEAWQKYSGEMNTAWKIADDKRLKPVQAFQKAELGGESAKSGFVFYPFSGPDVMYMQGFYPNGTTYVMAGLEMPGTILEPAGYEGKDLEAQFDGLREGISSLFNRSFFVTNEMSKQLRGQKVEGVLPVILTLLARMGNSIDNVRNVEIDDDGKLADLAHAKPKKQPPPGDKPDGLEIVFHKDGEKIKRKIYYFRLDLGPGLVKNPSFLTFSGHFGKSETLLKSASFLLHWPQFVKMKEFILANSTRIVQDDTGIRFQTLNKEHWNLRLYGNYTRPDKPFVSQFQPDMKAAFEEPGRVKPLGFSMGYGTGRRASHVVVAEHP